MIGIHLSMIGRHLSVCPFPFPGSDGVTRYGVNGRGEQGIKASALIFS